MDEKDEKKEPQEEHSYSFLQETIKKDDLTTRKGRRRIARIIIGGFLFGLFACLGFFAVRPWAQNHLQGNPDEITIPADENAADGTEDTNDILLEDEAAQILDGSSYQELLKKVDSVADQAKKSVVAVKSTDHTEEVTDAQSEEEAVKSESGLLIADNGQELLILTTVSVISQNSDLTVTFCDNAEYAAALKKQDKNLGLAIVSISRDEISESTWENISVAELGNSRIVYQGDLVITLGNVFGYAGGQGYGIISSTEYKAELSDGAYGILATDIATMEKGTGALFNLEGEVIGVVMPGIWENESGLLANAYAISDLKTEIELLSNGSSVPYVGVHGTYITKELAEQQEIPQGLYVNQVDADSPALTAGIQSGDIITKVGDTSLTSLESYERAVVGRTVGGNVKIKARRRSNNGYVDIDFTVKIGSLE
ncbi:MAG: S1C family serine protease [Hespellia sp.]|nr:S1C family serine protease [Hespellia sp.]